MVLLPDRMGAQKADSMGGRGETERLHGSITLEICQQSRCCKCLSKSEGWLYWANVPVVHARAVVRAVVLIS